MNTVRRDFLKQIAAGAAMVPILGSASGKDKRPNILVFCIDDLSEGLISCYGGGVPTPNIDAIAKNGVRFTHGYSTAAMCSPARVALLTGRYQARTGQDGNFRPPRGETHPVFGLDQNETTLAEYLKPAGYATGISGKWHIGEGAGFMAADRGFDFSFGTVANLGQNKETGKGEGDFFRGHELLESPGWLVTSPMYADEAVKFIEENLPHPFFLYVAFNVAHAPAVYSDRWAEKCADVPTENGQQRKTAQVGEMDEAVGTVMDNLRKLRLEENTLVFCISDNGRMDFVGGLNGMEGSNGLRGDKWKLWEAGIRVPWMVQWKGTIPAGRVDDTMVSHLDLVPTVLAAAGIEAKPEWRLDGLNLLPMLKGQEKAVPRDTLYWRIGAKKTGITHYAIRQGDWKLVKPTKEKEEPEYLYNLAADRGEQQDLSSRYPEKKAELKAAWEKWNAAMPESVN